MNENFEQHSYENGSTQPPKSRNGLLYALLCAIIIVSSVLTVMSICFPKDNSSGSAIIFTEIIGTKPTTPTQPDTGPTAPGEAAQIQLSPIPEGTDNVPQTGGLGLQDIYDKNIPSVVSVSCTFSNGSGSGTGVVLSQNGYLVTNAHVIKDAREIQVLLTDGRTFYAQIVGTDDFSDLAVLYINTDDLIPAEFGDSSQLRVGDAVVAIGDPLGVAFRGTMTDGIVSAINRNVEAGGRTLTLIQTNAALNSGNSGGPLINCFGQVIGINTMKVGIFSDDAGVEGLGFAIPSVMVRGIVNQLISQGYVSGRPALGLEGEWVSLFDQQFRRMPAGLYITDAPENSEIHSGDILLTVDGTRVKNEEELAKILYAHKAGDTVALTLQRSGQQYTVNITLTEVGR